MTPRPGVKWQVCCRFVIQFGGNRSTPASASPKPLENLLDWSFNN